LVQVTGVQTCALPIYWVDLPDSIEPIAVSIDSHGAPERVQWVAVADLEAGPRAGGVSVYPRLLRDALAGRWVGVRSYVERDGHYAADPVPPEHDLCDKLAASDATSPTPGQMQS
jgi:hypothetical protein